MADSKREVRALFAESGLPPPTIVAVAKSGMIIVSVVAATDFLCPLPAPWTQIIEHIPIIEEIKMREVTYSPSICLVRRANAPLTPPAQYFYDQIEKAAANHVAGRPATPL